MKIYQVITVYLFSGAAATMVFLMPDVAAAHLVTTGMGPVYDGIGHLLLTPEDLVPAIAVALYAGLRGKAPGRRALFFFPFAWLAGGLGGLTLTGAPLFPLSIISFMLLGALIAADINLSANITNVLFIAVGLVHGFYNGIAMGGGPGISGLFGVAAALFVLIAIASSLVVSLRTAWARVAVRVSGSWIAAVGLLMLGWFVKGSA